MRAAVLAAAGATLGGVVGAVLLLGGGGGSDDAPASVVVRTATPTPTSTATPVATPSPTPTATPTPTPEPTPEGPPTVLSVEALTAEFGDPPDATLGRFRIPTLGIDAPLGTRFVGDDGQMPNPTGPGDVVWYDFGDWEGFGGSPGGGQNAIYSAHVDYAAYVAYAGVDFRGRGSFFHLDLLSPGDTIEVDVNGETLTYSVQWRQVVSAENGNWAEILSAAVDTDSITLITCGGDFNFATRSYLDRTVVRAVRS